MSKIKHILVDGGIIAYPTETVYGIGCDPLNITSLQKINSIKQRKANKGFIVISNNLSHLQKFTDVNLIEIDELISQHVPTTVIVPCKKHYIGLLTGYKETIALRLSSHKEVSEICNDFDSAIVSTSLNFSGKPPINSYQQAYNCFANLVDAVIDGKCGLNPPSQIIDIRTKKILRQS